MEVIRKLKITKWDTSKGVKEMMLLLKDGIIRIRDKLSSHFKIRVAEPNIKEKSLWKLFKI